MHSNHKRIKSESIEESPIKVGEKKLETQDPLKEVNLGSDKNKKATYISAKTFDSTTGGADEVASKIQGLLRFEL